MSAAERAVGVDLDKIGADASVLRTAADALGLRWADTVALSSNAEVVGLPGSAQDDTLAVLMALPEKLRADLEILDEIRSAVDAVWQGVTAVCARVAHLAGDALDEMIGAVAVDPSADDPDLMEPVESAGLVVGAARAGVGQMDRALGDLDGDLVLIGRQ